MFPKPPITAYGIGPSLKVRMAMDRDPERRPRPEGPAHIGPPGFGSTVFSPGSYDFRPGRDPWRTRPGLWPGNYQEWKDRRRKGM